MIRLEIDGACSSCPFIDLEVTETLGYRGNLLVERIPEVICTKEKICDRQKMINELEEYKDKVLEYEEIYEEVSPIDAEAIQKSIVKKYRG